MATFGYDLVWDWHSHIHLHVNHLHYLFWMSFGWLHRYLHLNFQPQDPFIPMGCSECCNHLLTHLELMRRRGWPCSLELSLPTESAIGLLHLKLVGSFFQEWCEITFWLVVRALTVWSGVLGSVVRWKVCTVLVVKPVLIGVFTALKSPSIIDGWRLMAVLTNVYWPEWHSEKTWESMCNKRVCAVYEYMEESRSFFEVAGRELTQCIC